MKSKTEATRRLNDELRKGLTDEGQVVVTTGITHLGEPALSAVCDLVKAFDDFTPDNDPHGEHDFGSFKYEENQIFWKIDYYNLGMSGGSEDPADPAKTKRVLTIMLSSEY